MKKILLVLACLMFIILCIYIALRQKYKSVEEVNEVVTEEKVETIRIIVNDNELIVNLEDNDSARALAQKLNDGNIVVNATDYNNFEKVGDLGFSLPRRDKYISTVPGDVILYNGNQICIYYDNNTWNFTKLGKIDISQEELKSILGEGDVTYTITK